jgi:hypothetical protein
MKEVIVIKRRRAWEWQLRDQGGILIMGGREKSRPAARYQGYRALFMLLATSWRQKRPGTAPAFSRARRVPSHAVDPNGRQI